MLQKYVARSLFLFSRVWCYDLKNIFTQNYSEKIGGFFAPNTATLCKNVIITLFFGEKAIFSQKIGENRRKLWS
jgi:hypothetical protein